MFVCVRERENSCCAFFFDYLCKMCVIKFDFVVVVMTPVRRLKRMRLILAPKQSIPPASL